MSTKIVINVPEPVGASNVPTALLSIPGLPAVSNVVCRDLTVEVTFEENLTPEQSSQVSAYGLTLPLVSRMIRYAKVASEDCRQAITAGVQSDTTGTPRWYDTDVESQLNLVGAVVSQTDTYWHCRTEKDGPKIPILHTPAQLVALGQAIKAWKEERIYVFQYFRAQLEACTSVSQIDALWATWDAMAPPVYP
jgi:hypothetical protein